MFGDSGHRSVRSDGVNGRLGECWETSVFKMIAAEEEEEEEEESQEVPLPRNVFCRLLIR